MGAAIDGDTEVRSIGTAVSVNLTPIFVFCPICLLAAPLIFS